MAKRKSGKKTNNGQQHYSKDWATWTPLKM